MENFGREFRVRKRCGFDFPDMDLNVTLLITGWRQLQVLYEELQGLHLIEDFHPLRIAGQFSITTSTLKLFDDLERGDR
jgi:hypothetical protein